MKVNKSGYVTRRTSKGVFRDWFLVKSKGSISVKSITLPKHLIGRRIKIKVEVLRDE